MMTLKQARKAAGITQQALADIVGFHQPEISDLERGRSDIEFLRLIRIEQVLKSIGTLDWRNNAFSEEEVDEIIDVISDLSKRCPLTVVLLFVLRVLNSEQIEQEEKINVLQTFR